MTPIVLLFFLTPIAWALVAWRWQMGLYGLLVYLPFSGIPILFFFPSVVPVLYKDILFVIPLYLAVFLAKRAPLSAHIIPSTVLASIGALVALVVAQAFNPNGEAWLVALIGLKVWLMYIPLMLVAAVFFLDSTNRTRLLRMMVLLAWIPMLVGILQWLGSMTFGYQETMGLIFGEFAAEASTQGFAEFEASGQFFRIPSTFSYVTQYFGFILATITVCLVSASTDPSPRWRKLAWTTWALSLVAGSLCGARSAYLFIPLLLIFTFLFSGRIAWGLAIAVAVPVAAVFGAMIGGFDLTEMLQMVFGLTIDYGETVALQFIRDALSDTLLGMGTGMSTGAARFAFLDPESFHGFENYYAKIAYELGVLGLVLYVLFEIIILWEGIAILRASKGRQLDMVASLLAFFLVTFVGNFKGYQVDLDPVNVYFWIFLGLLWSIRAGQRDSSLAGARRVEAPA